MKKIIKSVKATPNAGHEEEDTELVEEDEKDNLQDDEEVGPNGIEAAQVRIMFIFRNSGILYIEFYWISGWPDIRLNC